MRWWAYGDVGPTETSDGLLVWDLKTRSVTVVCLVTSCVVAMALEQRAPLKTRSFLLWEKEMDWVSLIPSPDKKQDRPAGPTSNEILQHRPNSATALADQPVPLVHPPIATKASEPERLTRAGVLPQHQQTESRWAVARTSKPFLPRFFPIGKNTVTFEFDVFRSSHAG